MEPKSKEFKKVSSQEKPRRVTKREQMSQEKADKKEPIKTKG